MRTKEVISEQKGLFLFLQNYNYKNFYVHLVDLRAT